MIANVIAMSKIKRHKHFSATGDSATFSSVVAVQGKAVLVGVKNLALTLNDKVGVTSDIYNGTFNIWYIYQGINGSQNIYIDTPFVASTTGSVISNPQAVVSAPVTNAPIPAIVPATSTNPTNTITVAPTVTDSGTTIAPQVTTTNQVITAKVIAPVTVADQTVAPVILPSQAVVAPVVIATTNPPVQQADGSVLADGTVINPVTTNAGEVVNPTIIGNNVITADIHEPVTNSDGTTINATTNADGSVTAVDNIITPATGTTPVVNPDGTVTVQTDGTITIGNTKLPTWMVVTGAALAVLLLIVIIKR